MGGPSAAWCAKRWPASQSSEAEEEEVVLVTIEEEGKRAFRRPSLLQGRQRRWLRRSGSLAVRCSPENDGGELWHQTLGFLLKRDGAGGMGDRPGGLCRSKAGEATESSSTLPPGRERETWSSIQPPPFCSGWSGKTDRLACPPRSVVRREERELKSVVPF